MPVPVAQAHFTFETRALAVGVLLHGLLHAGQVVGVHTLQPSVQRRRLQCHQVLAQHGRPTLVECELARGHVELPGAHARAVDDLCQAPPLVGQGHAGAQAGADVQPQREVAVDLAIGRTQWRHDAVDPVERAVLGAVAHLAAPGLALGDGAPHVGPESLRVMARIDDAVALAQQFIAVVSADAAKRLVDLQNRAVGCGHRDQCMGHHAGQQGLVFALHGQPGQLGLLALAHVLSDHHVADEQTRIVTQGLRLDREHAAFPVTAQQAQLALKIQAFVQALGQLMNGRRVITFGHQQRHHTLAQGVAGRPAEAALEAFIDPGDALIAVGDDHRIGGALCDQRQALQVGGHLARQGFGALAAGALLAQQGRQQQAGRQATQQEEPGQFAVLLCLEVGRGAQSQRHQPARQGEHRRHRLETNLGFGVLGICDAGICGVRVVHQRAMGGAAGGVIQLRPKASRVDVAQASQQLLDDDGREQQAARGVPSAGIGLPAVGHRQEQHHTRPAGGVLNQGEHPADGGVAGFQCPAYAFAACALRGDVQPLGAEVA